MSQAAIGPEIKELREKRGMSQNQLAKKAGISQSGLSAIENVTKNPSMQTIILLSKALDINPDYFFYDNDAHMAGVPFPKDENGELWPFSTYRADSSVYPLSAKEEKLIEAFRSKPEFQPSVEKLLDFDTDFG